MAMNGWCSLKACKVQTIVRGYQAALTEGINISTGPLATGAAAMAPAASATAWSRSMRRSVSAGEHLRGDATARVAEAERDGVTGEAEGLKVKPAAAAPGSPQVKRLTVRCAAAGDKRAVGVATAGWRKCSQRQTCGAARRVASRDRTAENVVAVVHTTSR